MQSLSVSSIGVLPAGGSRAGADEMMLDFIFWARQWEYPDLRGRATGGSQPGYHCPRYLGITEEVIVDRWRGSYGRQGIESWLLTEDAADMDIHWDSMVIPAADYEDLRRMVEGRSVTASDIRGILYAK